MSAQQELENAPSDIISSVAFSEDGSKLFVSSWDNHIYVYETSPESLLPYTLLTIIDSTSPILDVCSNSDGGTIYWVGLEHDVHSAKTDTGATSLMSMHGEASNKIAYSKSHDLLLSSSWDGTMHVHNALSQTPSFIRIKLPAKPFALSLTSERAVVAMAERKVSVYNLQDLKELVQQFGSGELDQEIREVQPWQDRESSLKFMTRAVSCMPDGTGFATSSIEGRVGVEWFDPEAQKKMYAFKCHRQTSTTQDENGEEQEVDIVYPVNALAFHPVHGTFATGGGDGVVAMWDAQTKRRVRQYQKLGASVAAMDFSPDGKYLAIGVSPGFEDGKEDEEADPGLIKVVIRTLAENEAKGKAAKG